MPKTIQAVDATVDVFRNTRDQETREAALGTTVLPPFGEVLVGLDRADALGIAADAGFNQGLEFALSKTPGQGVLFSNLDRLGAAFGIALIGGRTISAVTIKLKGPAGAVSKTATNLGSWVTQTATFAAFQAEFSPANFLAAGLAAGSVGAAKVEIQVAHSAGGQHELYGSVRLEGLHSSLSQADIDKLARIDLPAGTITNIKAGVSALEVSQSAVAGKVDVKGVAVLDPQQIVMTGLKNYKAGDAGDLSFETTTPGTGGHNIKFNDGFADGPLTVNEMRVRAKEFFSSVSG